MAIFIVFLALTTTLTYFTSRSEKPISPYASCEEQRQARRVQFDKLAMELGKVYAGEIQEIKDDLKKNASTLPEGATGAVEKLVDKDKVTWKSCRPYKNDDPTKSYSAVTICVTFDPASEQPPIDNSYSISSVTLREDNRTVSYFSGHADTSNFECIPAPLKLESPSTNDEPMTTTGERLRKE